MTKTVNYLAIDLGAESGRTIVGSLSDGRIKLSETHRFINSPIHTVNGIHWDVLKLWSEINHGLSISSAIYPLSSLAIDTWGVDFALLDRDGILLTNPYHYRDSRTDGVMQEVLSQIPKKTIFEQTGIQFMQINTLFQLYSMVSRDSSHLNMADKFLTIPDLFNFWLTGKTVCEFTNATTTQCFDPTKREWAVDILKRLKIPTHIFPEVLEPGTILHPLRDEYLQSVNQAQIQVILPASHDTGSAVVSIPAVKGDYAWLSSGTWSILGIETDHPILTEDALNYNFTNEGGVNGTWRFSKNIMGLWIIQECKREWNISYDEITLLAKNAKPFIAIIDPDNELFLHPGNMVTMIKKYCSTTNQRIPQSKGEIARVVIESLALKYRYVLEKLELIAGKHFDPIHIIGGGTKNTLLCQFTADSTHRKVIAGPIEATAIGNILIQAITLGHIADIREARSIVQDSFSPDFYESHHTDSWDQAYEKLQQHL